MTQLRERAARASLERSHQEQLAEQLIVRAPDDQEYCRRLMTAETPDWGNVFLISERLLLACERKLVVENSHPDDDPQSFAEAASAIQRAVNSLDKLCGSPATDDEALRATVEQGLESLMAAHEAFVAHDFAKVVELVGELPQKEKAILAQPQHQVDHSAQMEWALRQVDSFRAS